MPRATAKRPPSRRALMRENRRLRLALDALKRKVEHVAHRGNAGSFPCSATSLFHVDNFFDTQWWRAAYTAQLVGCVVVAVVTEQNDRKQRMTFYAVHHSDILPPTSE